MRLDAGEVLQSGRHPAELPLARAAAADWQYLTEEPDAPIHHIRSDNLRLARTQEEVETIREAVYEQSATGLDISLPPTNADVRAIVPALSEAAERFGAIGYDRQASRFSSR